MGSVLVMVYNPHFAAVAQPQLPHAVAHQMRPHGHGELVYGVALGHPSSVPRPARRERIALMPRVPATVWER